MYLEVWDGIANEGDVEVGVQNGEADAESVEDHLGPDVHLADEVRTLVGAGDVGGAVLSVVVARQRRVAENLARAPPGADEQEVVDGVRPERRLVEVERHVGEGGVHQCQHDELVRRRVTRERRHELVARTAPGDRRQPAAAADVERVRRQHLVEDVDAEDDEHNDADGPRTRQR